MPLECKQPENVLLLMKIFLLDKYFFLFHMYVYIYIYIYIQINASSNIPKYLNRT